MFIASHIKTTKVVWFPFTQGHVGTVKTYLNFIELYLPLIINYFCNLLELFNKNKSRIYRSILT